ncbi:MAG: hypothetical protein Aurels2KO_15300 [Aureliella sp.]
MVFVLLCCRVTAYARLVKNKTIATPTYIQELTDRLARRLSVRRSVRVRVVDGPIGPAVVGILHPTLLLPRCIVSSQSRNCLQTLIAHELVHVRRGDLGWSACQTAATLFWWFHPCVWLASRQLTIETERSCDEETITSLGVRPADYARTLLDVLEKKSEIVAAPLVPGVRPIDITLKRMERIMRIGHGSHRRTPRWIIPVLIVGAALALPGTSWLDAQEKDQNDSAAPHTGYNSAGKRKPYANELHQPPLIGPAAPSTTNWPQFADGDADNVLSLTVLALEVPTKLLTELLDAASRATVSVTGGTISSDRGIHGTLTVESPNGTLETTSVTLASGHDGTTILASSTTYPTVLNESQQAILDRWLTNGKASGIAILGRPRLAARSGTQTSFQIGSEHPFVVSLNEDDQPVVQIVDAGLRGDITIALTGNDDSSNVRMQCELARVEIASVADTKVTKSDGTPTTLQRPTTHTQSTEFSITTPVGATVAATLGVKKTDAGETTTLCIITSNKLHRPTLDKHTLSSPKENSEPESPADDASTHDSWGAIDVTQQSAAEGKVSLADATNRGLDAAGRIPTKEIDSGQSKAASTIRKTSNTGVKIGRKAKLYADILALEVPTQLLLDLQPEELRSSLVRPRNSTLLTNDQYERILKWTLPENESGVTVRGRPTIEVPPGEPASFFSGSEIEVPAGYDQANRKPRLVKHEIGLRCNLTATPVEGSSYVDLEVSASLSSLVQQSAAATPREITVNMDGKTYRLPTIKCHATSFRMNLPQRSAVACMAGRERRDGKDFATMFVVSLSPNSH